MRLVRHRVGHKTHRDLVYLPDGRTVKAAAFPISIDTAGFEELARSEAVQERADEIREALGSPRKVFLGIDRLDYTKGIVARLRAFGELIAEGELDVEDAVFVQVATPSRERVEQYRILRDDIDRLVGRLNGDLGQIGKPAISYLHSSYPREEMAALYRAADIMVVTPFRDGMNLVAKEYVACRYESDGALVLSEFAGAADELRQAWLVNPYDINGIKQALLDAFHAEPKETTRRMRAMRKTVVEHDVAAWADKFLDRAGHRAARARQERAARPPQLSGVRRAPGAASGPASAGGRAGQRRLALRHHDLLDLRVRRSGPIAPQSAAVAVDVAQRLGGAVPGRSCRCPTA